MKAWHSAQMMGNASIRGEKNPKLSNQDSPSDSDDKGKFGLGWHIVVSNFAGHATEADFTPVHLSVLLVILLSPFVDQLPGHLSCLWQTKRNAHVKSWACDEFTHTLDSQVRESLPFLRPQSSWFDWPSWRRRPFAFSKGSQGPLELFFCCGYKYNSRPRSKDRNSSLWSRQHVTDSSLAFASSLLICLATAEPASTQNIAFLVNKLTNAIVCKRYLTTVQTSCIVSTTWLCKAIQAISLKQRVNDRGASHVGTITATLGFLKRSNNDPGKKHFINTGMVMSPAH